MALLEGTVALGALWAVFRFARSPAIAGPLFALALWFGVPALESGAERVQAAQQSVRSWQQERVHATACYYRAVSALNAEDEQRLDAVAADCEGAAGRGF